MGRHLVNNSSSSEFEDYHPGCMWGMLHILVSHHWHSIKGIAPPHRKHGRRKHALCFRNPKTVSFNHFNDEVQEYLAAEAVPLLVEQQVTKIGSADRTSGKARVKAVIAEEISSRSRLRRTISIHHFEPAEIGGKSTDWANMIILHSSDDPAASKLQVPSVPKTSDELVTNKGKSNPVDTANAEGCIKQNQLSVRQHALPQNNCDTFIKSSIDQNLSDAKKHNIELSCRQFKDCTDVMEIFKVNKNLSVEVLQNPDVQTGNSFQAQQTFSAKVRLKKSGSFPLPGSLRTRFERLSTLEHKQREIWSFPKGEKLPTMPWTPELVASETLEDYLAKTIRSKTDAAEEADVTQETSSPLALSHRHDKHGWHISFMSRFKDVKKKIKHALREIKKEKNSTSVDALFQRVPSRCHFSADKEEMSEELKEGTCQDDTDNSISSHEINGSDHDIGKDRFSHIRRLSSLNESMDKYARLFEYSFSREGKWHQYHSKSLRLTSEDKFASSGPSIKSFERRLSLPDLDSFSPPANEAASIAIFSEITMKTVMDMETSIKTDSRNDLKPVSIPVETKEYKPLEATEHLETIMIERGGSIEKNELLGGPIGDVDEVVSTAGEEVYEQIELVEPEKQENSPHQDQETGSTIDYCIQHEEETTVSVLETGVPNDLTCPTEFQVFEGFELNSRSICIDEPDTSIDIQDRSSRDSLAGFCCTFNCENIEKVNSLVDNNQFLHIELNRQDDADFKYVRDVLETSGFMEPECLGTWHSLDQPLSPTLFRELEAYFHHEVETSSENIGYSCNHQLLFDLMNEELLEVYESSLAYFPKPFSFTQSVRPLPKGNRLLEEVWKRISWYRSSRPKKKNQSLDDLVARDFAKGDGWMNLHLDVEDVALNLEVIICDELLDEIVCA